MSIDSRGPVLILVLLTLALVPHAHAGPLFFYKFTPVADTQGGFPYEALGLFPSINSGGRVAFIATLTGGNQAVMSRRGTGGPNTVQDLASGPYSSFGITTAINSLETILFVGLKQGDDEVLTDLVRGQGNAATKLLTFPNDRVDSFCGSQINIQKTVAFTGERRDGSHVILAVGAGDLTGPTRVIAEEGVDGFTTLGCAPSIGFDGTVAFTAIRNGRRAIFTRGPPPANQLTQIIDDSGPFVGFTDVAFNQQGGVAFGARLASGARTIQRIRNGVLTKVGDTSQIGGALSINESGQVAFEVVNPIGGATAVFLGPNSLFGRVVGPGSVVLGRTVASAHIERGSLNSVGQIAVHLAFFDGTQMIARGDPVTPDIFADLSALQLATADAGVSAGTPMPTFPIKSMLTFDVAFLSAHGEAQRESERRGAEIHPREPAGRAPAHFDSGRPAHAGQVSLAPSRRRAALRTRWQAGRECTGFEPGDSRAARGSHGPGLGAPLAVRCLARRRRRIRERAAATDEDPADLSGQATRRQGRRRAACTQRCSAPRRSMPPRTSSPQHCAWVVTRHARRATTRASRNRCVKSAM